MSRLLIIDDDSQTARTLSALLQREGHDVRCAASANEALGALRRDDPDLVLLDLSMPVVDGLELLDAVMDEPQTSGLRVAVYTGRDEPESREIARRLGACDYIVKGTTWDETYGRIRACLNHDPASTLPIV